MTINPKFEIAQKVEFDNRSGKDYGVICGYHVKPGGTIVYEVVWSDKKETTHYDFELKAI